MENGCVHAYLFHVAASALKTLPVASEQDRMREEQ